MYPVYPPAHVHRCLPGDTTLHTPCPLHSLRTEQVPNPEWHASQEEHGVGKDALLHPGAHTHDPPPKPSWHCPWLEHVWNVSYRPDVELKSQQASPAFSHVPPSSKLHTPPCPQSSGTVHVPSSSLPQHGEQAQKFSPSHKLHGGGGGKGGH